MFQHLSAKLIGIFVCAALSACTALAPSPTPTPISTFTPTATATASAIPTPTKTLTPEATPTLGIENITFTASDGQQITMLEFYDLETVRQYIVEHAYWQKGDHLGALNRFDSINNRKLAKVGKIISKIPGFKPVYGSLDFKITDTGFFVVSTIDSIGDKALIIYQTDKDLNYDMITVDKDACVVRQYLYIDHPIKTPVPMQTPDPRFPTFPSVPCSG